VLTRKEVAKTRYIRNIDAHIGALPAQCVKTPTNPDNGRGEVVNLEHAAVI
jgi:hypothetical protein